MSGVNDTYNPVLVKSFSEIFFSVTLENTGNCWDTEYYLNETVNDLAETITKLVLPALIVMSTALFSEPFSAVMESPDTAVTVGFPSPRASTMASVPDWPKTRYACHAAPLTRMVDNSDEI